ncbi:hypothetical protein ccbrp13_48270 [Ktedonobacteria bacterium brp13]|nr:hypothetical protein ccbrp13_48270 [Ktedonobacteria bacterium brp13]
MVQNAFHYLTSCISLNVIGCGNDLLNGKKFIAVKPSLRQCLWSFSVYRPGLTGLLRYAQRTIA